MASGGREEEATETAANPLTVLRTYPRTNNSSVQNISRSTVENPDPANGIILGHFGGCWKEKDRETEREGKRDKSRVFKSLVEKCPQMGALYQN